MAKVDFINQLKELGYEPIEIQNMVSLEYEIPVGKFTGKKVWIALQIGNDFPANPPPGPHFKPHLLPITGGGGSHPTGAIHGSSLGEEWQYWSRPFKEWGKTDRTVKTYLAYIRLLLDTV